MDFNEIYRRNVTTDVEAEKAIADFVLNIPNFFNEVSDVTFKGGRYLSSYNQEHDNQHLTAMLLRDKLNDITCTIHNAIGAIETISWSLAPKRTHTIVNCAGSPYAFELKNYVDWFNDPVHAGYKLKDKKGNEIPDLAIKDKLHEMNDILRKFFILKEFQAANPNAFMTGIFAQYLLDPSMRRISINESYESIWTTYHFTYGKMMDVADDNASPEDVMQKEFLDDNVICYMRYRDEHPTIRQFGCIGNRELLVPLWNNLKPKLKQDFTNERLADFKAYAIKTYDEIKLIDKLDKVI